jgi:hypothetical protein
MSQRPMPSGSDASKHTSARLAIVSAAISMFACSLDQGSPDFPGGSEANDTSRATGVERWSVTDLQSDELLAEGCARERVIAGVVPAQQLIIELRSERAFVASGVGLQMPEGFWCSDHPSITRQPVSQVDSLACWRAPKEGYLGSAARLLAMDVLPSPITPAQEPAAEPNPHLVAGQGYRFELEVLNAGTVFLESTGQCDDRDGSEGAMAKGNKGIVRIECGPQTPCASPETCNDGGCAVRSCDDAAPCPEDQVCVDGRCALRSAQ